MIDDRWWKKMRSPALHQELSEAGLPADAAGVSRGTTREQLDALEDLLELARSTPLRHRGATRWSRDAARLS